MTSRTPGDLRERESENPADADAAEGANFYHGGALAAARLRFPHAPEPWIDLSTGINPVAYPPGVIDADAWTRLPETQDIAALERVAAAAYRAPEPACVVAAPGTQALIQLLPGLLRPRRVAILGLTYAEHARCYREAGSEVAIVESLAEAETHDVAVVVNPNNPDGRIVAPDLLLEVAARMAGRGGALVVDEAFMDVLDPALSVANRAAEAGAIVLRSFGKTYGLAGLRLGFAIAPPRIAGAIRRAIGPWGVSGPAIRVGARALADAAWLRAEVQRLAAEAARMDVLLGRFGFEILGGAPLFRLAAHPSAGQIFEALGREAVLVRPFPLRPTWLRFGLPAPAQWAALQRRIERALPAACNQS